MRKMIFLGIAIIAAHAGDFAHSQQEKLKIYLRQTGHTGELRSEVVAVKNNCELVRAWHVGAYPGSGTAALVVCGSRSYGRHGEFDFADLVREKGWLKTPPPLDEYFKFLDYAEFEAVVMRMEHLQKSELRIRNGELVLTFMRGFMPNGRRPTRVIVGATGKVRISGAEI